MLFHLINLNKFAIYILQTDSLRRTPPNKISTNFSCILAFNLDAIQESHHTKFSCDWEYVNKAGNYQPYFVHIAEVGRLDSQISEVRITVGDHFEG